MKLKDVGYLNLFGLFLLVFMVIGCTGAQRSETLRPEPEASARIEPAPPEDMEDLLITQIEPEKVLPSREERGELVSMTLRDADIREVLLALTKKSDLNLIVEPDVSGTVTVDLKRVTLKEALDSLLTPLGIEYRREGKFIRIFMPKLQTRFFTLDYVAIRRAGTGSLTVSGGVAEAAGDEGGGGSGGGSGGGGEEEESEAAIETDSETDLWKDIQNNLETIVFGNSAGEESEAGAAWSRGDDSGKKLVGNPLSGIIMVRAYSHEIEEVARFLEKVEGSVHKEVIIQARIIEITLSDQYSMGIDWNLLDEIGEFRGTAGGNWVFSQGLRPETGAFQIGVVSGDFSALLDGMSTQGNLNMLSSPRICTLNNQKAVIKVGREEVYWEVETERSEEFGFVVEGAESRTVTVGIVLDVTPQIDSDGTLTMHVHPSVSEVAGESVSRFGDTRPILDIREADTVVRMRDGQTLVIGGMMKDRKQEELIKAPFVGDVPFLGKLFRHTAQVTQKTELVFFLTPTVLLGKRAEDLTRAERKRVEEMEPKFHLGGHPWKYGVEGERLR